MCVRTYVHMYICMYVCIYLSIYLSFVCFYCFDCSYSLTCHLCLPPQQSFIINNAINTFSMNIFVTMTPFPPGGTRPPQQQLVQSKRKPTMVVAITTYWATYSCDPSNQQHLQEMKLTTMVIWGQQQQQNHIEVTSSLATTTPSHTSLYDPEEATMVASTMTARGIQQHSSSRTQTSQQCQS